MADDMIPYSELVKGARLKEKKALGMLEDLIKFPSVAQRGGTAILECANCVEEQLTRFGYDAKQFPTKGSPVVFAERDVGASKTILLYHHYDVQPEDPLDAWQSSPWQLSVRGDRFYGRGASDDKGPYIANILGMNLIEEKFGQLPVNVRFVVEGEEEAGSDHLPEFTRANQDFLKADGAVIEGLSVNPGSPAELTCGAKGITYLELTAEGPPQFPKTDAHSGYGGAVPNAAWRLVWALASLKDMDENILIEGLNNLVRKPSKEESAAIKDERRDLGKFIKEEYGLEKTLLDRKGRELSDAVYMKPSISICGIDSGYQGPGSKTIIPARARAKIDFRLVPDLTVEKAESLLRAHLDREGFTDIQIKRVGFGYNPARTRVDDPFIRLVHAAAEEIAEPAPVDLIPNSAGSGPDYLFTPNAPCCMLTSDSDIGTNIHAPNENWITESMLNCMAFIAMIAERLGRS